MKKVTLITFLFIVNFLSAQVDAYEPFLPISCTPGNIASPSWVSSTNKLFSPCPKVKVGIGTSFPSSQLHVVSDQPGVSMRIQTLNWNNAEIAFQSGSGQSDLVFEDLSGNMYGLLRINAETDGPSMSFQNHMGGAISDLFKVTSSGTIYAQELIVQASPFPDYVFDLDYDLMPLGQVKEYINANGHLPNIPSAKEVEENGMGVSDMLVKQMEKIEELTLYILEVNDHVSDLERKNEELERQLIELQSK